MYAEGKIFSFQNLFLKDFIYLFLDRGEGREKETSMCGCLSWSTGDLDCNPGMCPDWDSNWQPFGLQAGTQSIEPHQPGLFPELKKIFFSGDREKKGRGLEKGETERETFQNFLL